MDILSNYKQIWLTHPQMTAVDLEARGIDLKYMKVQQNIRTDKQTGDLNNSQTRKF